MKNSTLIHPQHPGRHRPMLFVLLGVLTFSSLAFSADFQPNDEVKLTRDTPLLFLDKPIRQGMAGETFQVLAYQPEQKKVFLAAKDQAGKAIAVSVAEDSVSLVPADKAKVQADVLAAVSRQQYTVAKDLLDQAIRADPDDVELHSVSIALEAVKRHAVELNQATSKQKTVEADLQRQRHNADVTDHVNPLDAHDNSGRQRAAQMRAEATRIETQATQALGTAQASYDAALSALKMTTERPASKATISASGKTADARQTPREEPLKPWTDDEAVVPSTIIEANPGYQETIDFINAKLLSSGCKVWFGKNTQKLIIVNRTHVRLVDPKDLNPETKTGRASDPSGIHPIVILETTNARNSIQSRWMNGGSEATNGPLEGNTHRIELICEDNVEAEKVAKAFGHLVQVFGGKPDAF